MRPARVIRRTPDGMDAFLPARAIPVLVPGILPGAGFLP